MIAAERVTVFAGGYPAMYAAILEAAAGHDLDFGSLRVCLSAGQALPDGGAARASRTRSTAWSSKAMGCQKLLGQLASIIPRRARSVRSAHPSTACRCGVVHEHASEVPVGTPGEIQVLGHNVMKAYWNSPEATASAFVDGWFSTGDIGRVDEDGYFYLLGRKNNLTWHCAATEFNKGSRSARDRYPQ